MRSVTRYWPPVVVLILLATSTTIWWIWIDDRVWMTRHTIGVAIIVPSFVLWAVARHQLGASFTTWAEARTLVTHGVYAKIRNPIYLFAELLTIGIFVFFGQPWLFLVVPVSVTVQVRRARTEARVLDAAFGDDYRAYRARTWF